MGLFPYADRYPVVRSFPLRGRPRNEIVAEIEAMSAEDAVALEGKISGSIYSADEAHLAFLNEVCRSPQPRQRVAARRVPECHTVRRARSSP